MADSAKASVVLIDGLNAGRFVKVTTDSGSLSLTLAKNKF